MGIELILLGVIAIVIVIDFVLKRQKNKISSESLVDKIEGNTELKKNKTKKYILISLSLILTIPALYYININWQTISDKVLSEKPIKIEYSGPDYSFYSRGVFSMFDKFKVVNEMSPNKKWTHSFDNHIYSNWNDDFFHKQHIWGNVHFISYSTMLKDEVFGSSTLEFNDKNKLIEIKSFTSNYPTMWEEYGRVKGPFVYTIEYDDNDRIKSSYLNQYGDIESYNNIYNDDGHLTETFKNFRIEQEIKKGINLKGSANKIYYYKYNDNNFLSRVISKDVLQYENNYKNSSAQYLHTKIFHNDNNGNIIGHHDSRYECDLCGNLKTNCYKWPGDPYPHTHMFNYYTYDQYDNLIKSSAYDLRVNNNYQQNKYGIVRAQTQLDSMTYTYSEYDKKNNWLSREITINQDSLNKIIQTRKIIYY